MNPISDACAKYTGDVERHATICYNVTAAKNKKALENKCWTCGAKVAELRTRCICHVAVYCKRDCQKLDYIVHKLECRDMKNIHADNAEKASSATVRAVHAMMPLIGKGDEPLSDPIADFSAKLRAIRDKFAVDREIGPYFIAKLILYRKKEQTYWESVRNKLVKMANSRAGEELIAATDAAHVKVAACLADAEASFTKIVKAGEGDQKLLRELIAETESHFLKINTPFLDIRKAEQKYFADEPMVAMLRESQNPAFAPFTQGIDGLQSRLKKEIRATKRAV